MMLALARPLISRMTCSSSDGVQTEGEQAKKRRGKGKVKNAFIGNVAVFQQQDGTRLLHSLPPRPDDLVERVTIAFVGSDGDLRKRFLQQLRCDANAVKKAYELLRLINAVYAHVKWDAAADAVMRSMDGPLGLPGNLQACLRHIDQVRAEDLQVEQVGPAEALDGRGIVSGDVETAARVDSDAAAGKLLGGAPPDPDKPSVGTDDNAPDCGDSSDDSGGSSDGDLDDDSDADGFGAFGRLERNQFLVGCDDQDMMLDTERNVSIWRNCLQSRWLRPYES